MKTLAFTALLLLTGCAHKKPLPPLAPLVDYQPLCIDAQGHVRMPPSPDNFDWMYQGALREAMPKCEVK